MLSTGSIPIVGMDRASAVCNGISAVDGSNTCSLVGNDRVVTVAYGVVRECSRSTEVHHRDGSCFTLDICNTVSSEVESSTCGGIDPAKVDVLHCNTRNAQACV